MKRQSGVSKVDLDTRNGQAISTIGKPTKINMTAFERAAHGAGYTLKKVTLEAPGKVVEDRCSKCNKDVPFLELTNTRQRFEIQGKPPATAEGRYTGTLSGWGGHHARIKLLEPKKD